ncbi:bacteriohemerythrin [Rivihabitans pingtungensis]|jgi:hemerythrin|uniref:Hemerythrin n=1 Tax=Rivihabitans pingtungensis TaxID=1054498 RepID=A0A318KT20_9NEIS|nr:hemerythrin family protein [Rivihabitans pingtungensis]MCK6438203.1 hemerythrin family protein [Rivihabitans pingtungensis]PXX80880.1 hemerythrin [Rivihabitans pingtungensis]
MAAGEAAFTRLGVDSMDATHGEFIALVDELNHTADAQAFADGFARLGAHTQRHFEHESRLMRACRFPAIGEHESAHARVLGELAFMQRQVSAGRLAPARDYVRGLPDWFHSHLLTMDAALAGCLKQQDMAAPQHTPAA